MQPKFCARCGMALELREADEHRLRPVCPSCGWIVYLNPPIAVGVIAECLDGKIPLVLRGENPGRGLWGLPAGFMEVDETTEQAAKRECFEETGLTVELDNLWGVWSYYHEAKQTSGVLILYSGRVTGGEARAGSDSVEVKYFPPEEIPFDRLAFSTHRDALTRWKQSKVTRLADE